jgi:hypothetical protein
MTSHTILPVKIVEILQSWCDIYCVIHRHPGVRSEYLNKEYRPGTPESVTWAGDKLLNMVLAVINIYFNSQQTEKPSNCYPSPFHPSTNFVIYRAASKVYLLGLPTRRTMPCTRHTSMLHRNVTPSTDDAATIEQKLKHQKERKARNQRRYYEK